LNFIQIIRLGERTSLVADGVDLEVEVVTAEGFARDDANDGFDGVAVAERVAELFTEAAVFALEELI